MISIPENVFTKEYILYALGEEVIFERYLGFRPDNNKHYNTLRANDKNAGCYFYHDGRKWRFCDPAMGFKEDCFGIVSTRYGCNFTKACQIVANDFNLSSTQGIVSRDREMGTRCFAGESNIQKERKPAKIICHSRSFSVNDLNYWKQFNVDASLLERYDVRSVHSYFIFGKNDCYHRVKDFDLCYSYHVNGFIKVYRPYDEYYKWFGNLPKRYYQGYAQLPQTADLLVITKSLKDVMALASINIAAIAPASESSIISDNACGIFRERFGRIVSLYDFDFAGVSGAQRMKRKFGIKPLFLTNGRFGSKDYKAKDFSDLVKRHGMQNLEEFISDTHANLQYH